MGELGVFAYILETDCDTRVRSQGLNRCAVYSQDVDSNSKSQLCGPSLPRPPFPFEAYHLAPDPGCPCLADNIRQDHSRRQYSCWQNLVAPSAASCVCEVSGLSATSPPWSGLC